MGILIAKNAGGTTQASDTAVALGQSVASGGSIVLNGSLISGGRLALQGVAYKIKVVSAGNDSGKTFTFRGKFFASNSVGGYSETATVSGANAGSALSALYALEIDGGYPSTLTASSITVGLAADSCVIPTTLSDGSLYQLDICGTFGGATAVGIQKYNPTANEWIAVGTTVAAAAVTNVEIPAGTTVRPVITGGSATTALVIEAFSIRKDR